MGLHPQSFWLLSRSSDWKCSTNYSSNGDAIGLGPALGEEFSAGRLHQAGIVVSFTHCCYPSNRGWQSAVTQISHFLVTELSYPSPQQSDFNTSDPHHRHWGTRVFCLSLFWKQRWDPFSPQWLLSSSKKPGGNACVSPGAPNCPLRGCAGYVSTARTSIKSATCKSWYSLFIYVWWNNTVLWPLSSNSCGQKVRPENSHPPTHKHTHRTCINTQGLPWWFSGCDSALPTQGAWIRN